MAPLLGAEEQNSQITATGDYCASITATRHPTANNNYDPDEKSGETETELNNDIYYKNKREFKILINGLVPERDF